MVAQGNLTMSGEDYQKWSVDQYAWDWIASELKLTITGDYVTPVVEQAPVVEDSIVSEETVAE
jgi:hypothetical protein